MERPRGIDSGEAMRWNVEVEQRRRVYHERRCNENPIYKRAYERQQEMLQRMQKMNSMAMAQLQNAMNEPENTKCQQATEMRENYALGNEMFSAGVLALLLDDTEAEQRLKDMAEELPYVEQIRKADREFDSELIRLNGFEW